MEEEEKRLNELIADCDKILNDVRDARLEQERIYNYIISIYKKLNIKEKERNELKRKIISYYMQKNM